MTNQIQLPLSKISLRFHKEMQHIEKTYRSYYYKSNLNHFRICHVFGLFFYSIFIIVDLLAVPENISAFLTVRFAIVCPLFCMGIMISFFSWYKYVYVYMLCFFVLLTAVGYIAMGVLAPQNYHFIYFLGLLACLVFGYTFLRLPVWPASATGLIAGAIYYLAQIKYDQLDSAVLTSYLFYLIGFELLFMIICYTSERSYRKGFYLFYLLGLERDKLSNVNQELENMFEIRSFEVMKLEKALKKVKKLSGMLPICASCKKIRDDKGYWTQIENYVRDHTEAEFSHGLCPDCQKRLYPEFTEYMENKNEK
jgi:hypothetical protein